MRIWHLMAGVLAVAIMSALLARSPELGGLVVLDLVSLGCAYVVAVNDHRVLSLWTRAQLRSERIRGLRGRFVLLAGGSIVLVYAAIISVVLSVTFLLVTGTIALAIAQGAMVILKQFNGPM